MRQRGRGSTQSATAYFMMNDAFTSRRISVWHAKAPDS